MKPFTYTRTPNPGTAIQTVAGDSRTKFIAGGTNLIDLMKENVEQPDRLVDISRLELTRIEERSGGLRLGALARNSDTARGYEHNWFKIEMGKRAIMRALTTVAIAGEARA